MNKLLAMFAESPVHAGTGTELGPVDLPIQRERATQMPCIHSSGVKGVIRDMGSRTPGLDENTIVELFGSRPPETLGSGPLEPSALAFSDARLVLFPLRTSGPIFAWATSPYLLSRLRRDALEAGLTEGLPERVPDPGDEEAVVTGQAAFPEGGVLLEEFRFGRRVDSVATQWAEFIDWFLPDGPSYEYWRDLLPKAFVIVSDENMRDFVTHATEVVTRVHLNPQTKTVVSGHLWTEEYLPQDSLLYSVVAVTARRRGDAETLFGKLATIINTTQVAQFGGKETIGRGIVRLKLLP